MRILSVIMILACSLGGSLPVFGTTNSPASPRLNQNPGVWMPVGPSPIQGCPPQQGPAPAGGMCSGKITSIAPDPTRPGTIYVGTPNGGVWKTTDQGRHWLPLFDNQPSLAVGAIAVDRAGNIYAGTGGGIISCDSYYGEGIFKSTDGGATWTQLPGFNGTRNAFTKIIVDPSNIQKIIVGVEGFVYSSSSTAGSCDSGDHVTLGAVANGVYVSTDGGNHWVQTFDALTVAGVTDIAVDATDPRIVYVAADGNIYMSTDGASSFPLACSPSGCSNAFISSNLPVNAFPHFSLTSPFHGGLIVALPVPDNSLATSYHGEVWETTQGATNCQYPNFCQFTQLTTPIGPFGDGASFCEQRCLTNIIVAADQANPNTLYLGGINLYRSTNGGSTWTDLGGWSTGHLHVEMNSLAIDPFNHHMIYLGTDGGLWSAANGDTCPISNCWTNLNQGLGITEFQALAVHPTNDNTYFGGTLDVENIQHIGSSSVWNMLDGGQNYTLIGDQSGWTGIDNSNASIMYDTANGPPRRSNNGGTTWKYIINGLNLTEPSQLFRPLTMDPTSPSTLFLGTYRLYKTTNRGESWSLVQPGLNLQTANSSCNPQFVGTACHISAIAVAPSNHQIVYVGTNFGMLFGSSDGGAHFSEIDQSVSANLPTQFLTKLVVDSLNPFKVVVSFSGFANAFYPSPCTSSLCTGSHVFVPNFTGVDPNTGLPCAYPCWNDISHTLPDFPVDSVALNSTSGTIYAGTDNGVFVDANNTGVITWTRLGTGLPRSPVYDLLFTTSGHLLAATHGRGAWEFFPGSASDTFNLQASPTTQAVQAGTNATYVLALKSLNGFAGQIYLSAFLVNPNGPTISVSPDTITLTAGGTATSIATFTTFPQTNAGTYMLTVLGIASSVTHTVTIQASVYGMPGQWVPVGPSPIGSCIAIGSTCSGRVSAIATDPTHQGTIYLGGAQGGVWKSTNYGTTWTPLTDNQLSLATGSIAVDSIGNVYVGTGEANYPSSVCGDAYYGVGILKSSDGGATWTQLGFQAFGRSSIAKILVDPNNSSILFASTTTGHSGSSTAACLKAPPGVPFGVYRSADGGKSWTRTLTASVQANDLAFNPSNPSVVYAAMDGSMFQSTDTGTSWTPIGGGFPTTGVGRIALATSASSPQTLLATLEVGAEGQLWRSITGGSTWSQVPVPPGPHGGSFCHGQCYYDLYVAFDPTTTNTIYLGGLDLFRSTDAGVTWTDLGGYAGGVMWDSRTGITSGSVTYSSIHPDQHAIAFGPTAHSSIYVGNDGGVWSSTAADTCDPTLCWTDLNPGLQLTQFQSISAHPTDGNVYLGGTQDNGSPLRGGQGLGWRIAAGGDGGWTMFDRNNPLTIYHTFFGPNPQRSDDGGTNWKDITAGIQADCGAPNQCQFYIPMAMDPTTPSTLYLGTYRLYNTTSRGDTWTLLSPGLDLRALSLTDIISAITVAPSNGQYLYVGTNLGRIFVSSNGGRNFAERDVGLPIGNFNTKIAVDPTNPQRVFATFSGFGAQHVLTSGNAGVSWHDITGNLPPLPVDSVVLNSFGNTTYVGTDTGVWVDFNNTGTVSWSRFGRGLPTVATYDLVFTASGDLLAATHGRGAWRLSFGHSVSVTSVIPSRSFAYTGAYSPIAFNPVPIRINVTLSNTGTFPETFNVTVMANSTIIGSQTLTLGLGNTTVITFNFDTKSLGKGYYTISSLVVVKPGEQNLGSNALTMSGAIQVRKAGDIDADGAVDISDLIGVWQHQFTNTLPSVYDIDNSGSVDITDLIITWQHEFT